MMEGRSWELVRRPLRHRHTSAVERLPLQPLAGLPQLAEEAGKGGQGQVFVCLLGRQLIDEARSFEPS